MKFTKKIIGLLLVFIFTVTPITASATVVDINGSPSEITIPVISKESDIDKAVAEENLKSIKLPANEKETIIPVDFKKKGQLTVVASYMTTQSYGSTTFQIFSDNECMKQVGYTLYCNSNKDKMDQKDFYIPRSGTFYFKITRTKAEVEDILHLGSFLYDGSDRTLKNNTPSIAASDMDNKEIYYKVTADKTGQFTVDLNFDDTQSYGSAYVTLMNSKKKVISEDNYLSKSSGQLSAYFSVDKGTYYVKVSTSSGIYAIKSKFAAVSDSSGASQSKATALSKGGKAKKGIITAGDKVSKVDWYKVSLPKKQKVTFQLTGTVTGSIKIEVINGNGRSIFFGTKYLYRPGGTVPMKSDGAWDKGTYFIKITKRDANSAGTYTISVK